jgi:hypothetical protein
MHSTFLNPAKWAIWRRQSAVSCCNQTGCKYKESLFLCFRKALLILQLMHFQRFMFSWLALVTHRILIPAMLEGGQSDGRWEVYTRLMETAYHKDIPEHHYHKNSHAAVSWHRRLFDLLITLVPTAPCQL